MGFQGGEYYSYIQHPSEEREPASLDGASFDALDKVVSKQSVSNADQRALAIERADGFAFQVANPWFMPTESNVKLVKDWLRNKGIVHATYPEIAQGAEELAKAGLLSIDGAAFASHLDGNDPKKFRGAVTKCEYDSLDTMIAQERHAVIQQLGREQTTDLEDTFNRVSLEDAQSALKQLEKRAQANADAVVSRQNADSWITLHEEYRDDERNGRLLVLRLNENRKGTNTTGPFSIGEYEKANRQLVADGLIRQNPKALENQYAQEVQDRAQEFVNSTFDETEAYQLPLDEVRRRAQGNYSGFGD